MVGQSNRVSNLEEIILPFYYIPMEGGISINSIY